MFEYKGTDPVFDPPIFGSPSDNLAWLSVVGLHQNSVVFTDVVATLAILSAPDDDLCGLGQHGAACVPKTMQAY